MQFAKQRLLEIFPFFMTFCQTIVFIQNTCGQQWRKKYQRKIKCNQLRKHVGLNAHFYSKYIKSHNINCVPQQSIFKAPSLCNCFNVQFSSIFRHHFVLFSFVCVCVCVDCHSVLFICALNMVEAEESSISNVFLFVLVVSGSGCIVRH